MGVSGVFAGSSFSEYLRVGNPAGVGSVSGFRVSDPCLSVVIGDSVEVSDAAGFVAEAFADFSNVDTILRCSDDGLRGFAKEYARRRDLIVQAGSVDETYRANRSKLLDALDTAMRGRVSVFADDCVSLINKAASTVSAGDKELVRSGWVQGYSGSAGLSLTDTEKQGIKADIVKVFASTMESGETPAASEDAPALQGQYLGSADFAGRSFYRKLEDFSVAMVTKGFTRWAMEGTEKGQRSVRAINNQRAAQYGDTTRADLKAFQRDWERYSVELEDTSAVDVFSGGLKLVLGRFDAAASVYKVHSDLEFDQGATVGESVKMVVSGLGEELLEGGVETFEKYVSRVVEFADRFTGFQKALLGVMYQDAEVLGAENAFKKVDAFAKALVTNNFYGFRFEAQANPKNLNVLNFLQWFNDDESSTGLSGKDAPVKLSVEERKALITLKYSPHLVKGDESIQNALAHALLKQGKTDEIKKLKLKYRK